VKSAWRRPGIAFSLRAFAHEPEVRERRSQRLGLRVGSSIVYREPSDGGRPKVGS
jgi:hypothetical protein